VSLLDIHVLGSPILRQETERVEQITPELRRLVDDMFDTMDKAKGVGLAAPQVGRRERLAVVEVEDARLHPVDT
jgi:peptide deformylase